LSRRVLFGRPIAFAIACLIPLPAAAGTTKALEQSAVFLDSCGTHYGQLEHDARQDAFDFCANLGGVDEYAPFEQSEEIIRENEFSKKYRCTVTGEVECYASE